MSVLKHKNSSEKTIARISGNAFIIILTALCYIVGAVASQSENFYRSTLINFSLALFGVQYIMQGVIGMIAPIIVYNIAFSSFFNRKPTDFAMAKANGGTAKYIYSGWTFWAVLAGVLALIVAFIVYLIAFKGTMILVKPLMIWVWLAQAVLSSAVFYIPLCKPIK